MKIIFHKFFFSLQQQTNCISRNLLSLSDDVLSRSEHGNEIKEVNWKKCKYIKKIRSSLSTIFNLSKQSNISPYEIKWFITTFNDGYISTDCTANSSFLLCITDRNRKFFSTNFRCNVMYLKASLQLEKFSHRTLKKLVM